MESKTCCFFGHRDINETQKLKTWLVNTIEQLITQNGIDTFLFGSRSRFDLICLETVTAIKKKYPYIKRVYVRAEYPYINKSYETFLLERYDETYFPEKILGAGKAIYIERNYEMIEQSGYCIVYYDESYTPRSKKESSNAVIEQKKRKSGTKTALEFAIKKNRKILLADI